MTGRALALFFAVVLLAVAFAGCARTSGTSTDVAFESHDGVVLHGSFVMPDGAADRVPGVVLLHGAEAATRSMVYRMHANLFLDRGMAVLLYDKRGAGESGGDHDSAHFTDFVEDALAAIAFLREQPGVDPERIGVVGASQSGWLTPEIAERTGDLAFVINKVGPCLSWRDTVAWEVYHDRMADGESPEVAREQAALSRRRWDYWVDPTPEERASLEANLRDRAERGGSHLPAELPSVDPGDLRDIAYDPGPYLDRLETPMLYVYGSEDINVPTRRCVARLTELKNRGRPVSYHVYDGEGHELGGVGFTGYRFVDGYAELLGDFAERNVTP